MKTFNRKPTLVASLTVAIQRNLRESADAAERVMLGQPMPQDMRIIRAGEKAIELLLERGAS